MELNKTKAMVEVPRLEPTCLYKYFINTHHLIGNIIKGKKL